MTFRHGRLALLLAPLAAAVLWVWGSAADDAPKPAPAPPPAGRLSTPQRFRGIDDPETKLGEALRYIGSVYGVGLDVNEQAFRDEQIDNVLDKPVGAVPPMTASLDRVLRKVLPRLKAASGAAYMVRADHVEITTGRYQRAEVWGPAYDGPFLPLVNADFDGRPLAEALRQLAAQSGRSVVVDARAADKAKTAVSATFTNLPLDTAVRILADMAGLKSVVNDNGLYVSTEERPVSAALPPALGQQGLSLPARSTSFDKRPLNEALQELLKPTGLKLVVDAARAGEKSKVPVTANLDGTTTESALRLLADMADLRPVIYGNVVYLTTKDNAAGFIKAAQPDFSAPGLGGGAGALGFGGGMSGMPR